jgi:predicted nucleic acid-binding protein
VRGWLLDTNVVSELRKPHCDARVRTWADEQPAPHLFLSTVTLAEIRYGIELLGPADPLRRRLESWLARELRPWFADRICAIDEEVLLVWRRLVEKGRAMRMTFAQPDLFIAAIAVLQDLCVVTRNVGDYAAAGVAVLNPWTDTQPRLPVN